MDSPSISSFRLLRRLAIGGMGEVFLAEQVLHDEKRKVALKRILPHLLTERQFIDRFVDEARLMTHLRHRNIIPVHELRHDEWGLYMVMEYLSGHDVRSINHILAAREDRWPAHLAVWLIKEVCEGLHYAHEQTDESDVPLDLIHRDVSPSNILLSRDAQVKVIDFGVARAHGNIHQSISGALQGKLAYMSPEQARGESLCRRSDIYSMGITLYEMIAGVRPREGQNEAQILQMAQEGRNLHLEDVWPEGDDDLCHLINRSIVYDKDSRYETALEMGEALGTWLSNTGYSLDQKSELLEWYNRLGLEHTNEHLSLDEAMELQLLSALPSNSHAVQNTLSVSSQIMPVTSPTLTQSISGLLVTAERQEFSAILDSVVDDASLIPSVNTMSERQEEELFSPFKIRLTFIALTLILLGAAIVLYWSNYQPTTLFNISLIQPNNGSETKTVHIASQNPTWQKSITIDGVEWDPNQEYPSQQPLEICINHQQWRPICTWFRLNQLELSSRSVGTTAYPTAMLYLKSSSLALRPDQSEQKLEEVDAPALKQSTPQVDNEVVPSSRSKISTQPKQSLTSSGPSKRVKNLPTTWLIQIKGAHQTADIRLNCGQLAKRLDLVRLDHNILRFSGSNTGQCRINLKGYAGVSFKLKRPSPYLHLITLQPQGVMSIRVHPPAAKVYLDGVEVSNPMQEHTVVGKQHRLQAIYNQEGEQIKKEWLIEISPDEKVKRFFDLIQEKANLNNTE